MKSLLARANARSGLRVPWAGQASPSRSAYEPNPRRPIYRRFSCLECKQGLSELSPERGLVPAEAVDNVVLEIGQAQKADRDVPRCIRRVGLHGRGVKLGLAVSGAGSIPAEFGVDGGGDCDSPLSA